MWQFLTLWSLAAATIQSPELSKEHQRFLDEEAVYIMTPDEREGFLALAAAGEREEFIARFWQVRDRVPETAVNEFHEEHSKRIREANEKYRGSRAGWTTEQGRTYITLGPPQDVQTYPSSQDLYPLEIWYYYNLDIPLFPSALQFLFFKRNGVGEYRLFSPAFDGMKALIADPVKRNIIGPLGQIPFSARQSWDIDIIKAAESVGPGENLLSSEAILSDLRTPGFVFEKSRRNLTAQVTAEASFGGELPIDFAVDYFRGEDGFSEVHVTLEVSAENLNVSQYDDRMLGRYDLIGTVTHVESGEPLEEFRDSLELEIAKSDWETARHFPVLFQKRVGLLPGRYRLELYVRDFVGRKLAILDRNLIVPGFAPDAATVSSFLAAFKADETPLVGGPRHPHEFSPLRLYPKANHVFGAGQRVLGFFQVYYPEGAAPADAQLSVRFTLSRGDAVVLDETNRYRPSAESPGIVDVLKVISGPILEQGEYRLEAFVSQDEIGYSDLARVDFSVVSAPQEMGRLSTIGLPPEESPAQAYLNKARHYVAAGRSEEAIRLLRVALDYEPYFLEARLLKARVEVLSGNPAEGEKTALEALDREKSNVDGLALVGLARFRMGRFGEAAEAYRKALEIGGEDTALLNALAETEFEGGNREAALEALHRSLELEPNQPQASQFLEEVKRSP